MFGKDPVANNTPGYRGLARLMSVFTLAAANTVAGQPLPAEAWDDSLRKSPEADVITVTAPKDSPLTVVTSPKTPRQPVPASDGADYLKTMPGFSQVRNGGTNGDPIFRGMFGSRLKILAAGAEMQGACPGRMDAPTSYISPESFDLLTLIKGPQTVLWGPGASAGVLRFERARPRFEKAGIGADASLLAGSNQRRDKNIDGRLGNELGYLQLIGTQSRAGDYHDGASRAVPSRWKKWSGDVALGWTPDNDTLLEISGGKGDGEASYAARGLDGAQFKRDSLGVRMEKQGIGEVLDTVEAQIYYNYVNHIMDNSSLRNNRSTTSCCCKSKHQGNRSRSRNLDRRTLGGRVQADWLMKDLKLQSGLDMQSNTHRGKAQRAWSKDAHFEDYGVFGELTWYADEQRRWVGGARLDHRQAQMFGTAGARSRSAATPAGFIRYEHRAAAVPVMFYTGIGYTKRFPDYWELFSPTYGPDGNRDPFASIKSEKTRQLDIGAHYNGETFNGWLSAYLGRVEDFILIKYNQRGANRTQADNIAATTLGGEMGLEYKLTEQLKTDASMAYAWGKNRRDHRPLPQIPPLEARFGLTYERERWSTTALWRLVASQHRVALNEGNVVGKDYGGSAGFSVLSANIAVRISEEVKLSSGIDNIFNKVYSEHLNLAGHSGFGYAANEPVHEPGRTLWAKLNVTF